LIKELEVIAHNRKLQGFERVKSVHLATDAFTVENELLTPTMKLKRPVAAKAFRAEIDELYKRVNTNEVKAKL